MCLINQLASVCLVGAILTISVAEKQVQHNSEISSDLNSEFVEKRSRRDILQSPDDNQFAFEEFPNEDAEMVAKRMRDFVGKRTLDEGILMDKKMRDFVGKRTFQDAAMEKRMREFVGKRSVDDISENKRFRDFVGKRSTPFESDLGEYNDYEKRMRDFVGKRIAGEILEEPAKRVRDFVGKRSYDAYPIVYLGARPARRYNYVRELVGKRSSDFPLYGSAYGMDKRVRDFVGK